MNKKSDRQFELISYCNGNGKLQANRNFLEEYFSFCVYTDVVQTGSKGESEETSVHNSTQSNRSNRQL